MFIRKASFILYLIWCFAAPASLRSADCTDEGTEGGPEIVSFPYSLTEAESKPTFFAQDPGGWFWLGYQNDNFLSVFDGREHFFSLPGPDSQELGCVKDLMFDFFEKRILLATEKGLWVKEFEKQNWAGPFGSEASEVHEFTSIAISQDGALFAVNPHEGLFSAGPGQLENWNLVNGIQGINAIHIDNENHVWLGLQSGALLMRRPDTDALQAFFTVAELPSVSSIVTNNDGRIVAGTDKGCFIIKEKDNDYTIDPIVEIPSKPVVQCQAQDGILWVLFKDSTLGCFSYKQKSYFAFNKQEFLGEGGDVRYIFFDDHKRIWLLRDELISRIDLQPEKNSTTDYVDSENAMVCLTPDSTELHNFAETALPRSYHGKLLWHCLEIKSDTGIEDFESSVILKRDLFNNVTLRLKTDADRLMVSSRTYSQGEIQKKERLRLSAKYPFPDDYHFNVKPFAQYDESSLSSERLLNAISPYIKESSKNNNLKVVQDLIYSEIFSRKDGLQIVEHCFDATTAKGPEKRTRIAAQCLRVLGIPVRLVAQSMEHFLGEVWISQVGWIPFDVSDIPEKFWSKKRISFPLFTNETHFYNYKRGVNDEMTVIFRNDRGDATFETKKEGFSAENMKKTLILFKPAETENIPAEARLPLVFNITAALFDTEHGYSLNIYDQLGNAIFKIPVKNFGVPQVLNIVKFFSIEFVAYKIDEYVVLNVTEWIPAEVNPLESLIRDR